MRRATVLVAVLATLMVIPSVANAATVDDFTGIWTAIDEDGSRMTLRITARTDGDVDMTLRDEGGSLCGVSNPRGKLTVPLVATGIGIVTGNDLEVSFDIVCRNGVNAFGVFVKYTLQSPGTMTREIPVPSTPVVWTRRAAV